MRARPLVVLLLLAGCRIETASPGPSASAPTNAVAGEVWVYTSIYRQVLDALDPLIAQELPGLTVHWFQAGSEKVSAKLEAELAAGGTPCDVLMTSDPFLYQRLKHERRWVRYASPNGVRTSRTLVDLDGEFAAVRLSTMVLVYRRGGEAPVSFEALTEPGWKNEVAIGDPLTSGTAFTWAVFMDDQLGSGWAQRFRDNGARVAGGNAAVLQKVEGGEAMVGVLLLENALAAKAKGSPIEIAWPRDGAVVVPGFAGVLATTRNERGAKALIDLLLSEKGQAIVIDRGDMHGVDPRRAGPRETIGEAELLERARPWNEAMLERGLAEGPRVKATFSEAFAK